MKTTEKQALGNVILFSIIVLSCGWIGRLVDLKVGTDANGSLGQLIWIVTPILTMVVLRTFRGDGWQDFGIKLHLKQNLSLYLVSILFYPLTTLIIVLVGTNLGWMDGTNLSPLYLSAVGMALLPSLFKNLFEEFAWRGYLAPRLFSLGSNRLFIHIIVGVIWAAWHIPYLSVLMGTTESMSTFLPRMIFGLVVLSIVYGEIRLMTNSVWPAVLLHTVGNAVVDTMILHKYVEVRAGLGYLAMPSPEGLLTIVITTGVGIWLYNLRKNRIKNIPPSVSERGMDVRSADA